MPAWQDLLHLEWISDRGDMHQREIRPHQHDALLQVVYVRNGQGEVSLENSRMAFHAPCLILLPQRTVHAFRYSAETDGPVITAAQRPLESMAYSLQRSAGNDAASGGDSLALDCGWHGTHLATDSADSERSARPERDNVAAGHALLIALLVQITRLNQPTLTARPANGRRSALLGQFRELIDQHFKQHWPLALYAEALGITPATLGRACREELGESPTAVINERIVREAQRQLAYTALDIQRIAHDLGYADAAYFSRFFRKQAGLKPANFAQRSADERECNRRERDRRVNCRVDER